MTALKWQRLRRVRRNRRWLALAAVPWLLVLLQFAAAAATGVGAVLAPVGHFSLFGAIAVIYALQRNKNPSFEAGAFRLDDEALFWNEAPLCTRQELQDATLFEREGHWFVRLKRRGKLLAQLLEVPSAEEGQELLQALGFGVKQRAAEFRGRSRYFSLPAWQQVLLPVLPMMGGALTGAALYPVASSLAVALGAVVLVLGVIGVLGSMLVPSKILVGVDGIFSSWLGRPYNFPFAELKNVASVERRVLNKSYLGFELTDKYDRVTFLPIGQKGWAEEEFQAVGERVREALEAYRSGIVGLSTDALARGNRTTSDWLVSLKRVGAMANVDARTSAVPTEELTRIVSDPSARPTTRVGAAVALTARGQAEDIEGVRIAAAATASTKLRIALQKATEAEEEAELTELMAELEQEERRSKG